MQIPWKVALGLVAAAAAGSVASVAAQSPAPSPSPGTRPPKMWWGPGHLGGAIRSESVFPGTGGGPVRTVRTDRGELRQVDGRTLVISEQDGTTVRVAVGEATRIVRDGKQASLSDLRPGDRVWTVRERTGDADFQTVGVKAISAERAAELEQRRAACQADPASCPRRGGWRFRPLPATPAPAPSSA